MKLLAKKFLSYDAPQVAKKMGIYPYFREIESDQDAVVTIDGKRVLMFGSNSYLGLTNHPKIKEASIEAIKKYGTGCAGSRFLNGTLDIHTALERKLAKLLGKEDSIVYSTGFGVNLGVVSSITSRADYLIYDEMDHASIIDGRRLSFSTCLKYKHNDMESLEQQLKKCQDGKIKLIVVDGVFSMEGDVVKLTEICALAEKYDASVMVDEAHSIGVFGNCGRGLCNHLGMTDKVDLIMGTFSKSLASIGGVIAGDKEVINYLRHNSRPYIFSASLPPSAVAAVSAAVDIMLAEPERQEHLWKLTEYALNIFRKLGFEIGHTSTPIIPLYIRDNDKTFKVTRMLLDDGVFVNPVVSPAVAPNDTLIRFSIMATHTFEQLDEAIEKIHKNFMLLDVLECAELLTE